MENSRVGLGWKWEGADWQPIFKRSQRKLSYFPTFPRWTAAFLKKHIATNTDFLVSVDNDLLDLKEYEGIKIVDVDTFLHPQILEKKI